MLKAPADTPAGHQARPPQLPLHLRVGAGRTPTPEAGLTAQVRLQPVSCSTCSCWSVRTSSSPSAACSPAPARAHGGVAFVEAPAGQGKTTLLRALRAQARRHAGAAPRPGRSSSATSPSGSSASSSSPSCSPPTPSAASGCWPAPARSRPGLRRPVRAGALNDACHVRLHGARLARRQPRRGAAAGARRRRRPLGRRRQPARARHARAPARGAADRADRRRRARPSRRCSSALGEGDRSLPAAAER